MRKSLPAAVTAAMSLVLVASAAPAFAQSPAQETNTASLSVLHAVPDTPVDVYVNGELTLDDFAPGQLAGPLELPAGDIEVAITASDAQDASSPVIGPVDLTLGAGTMNTAVARLDAEGAPTATAFVDDTSGLEAGQGRVTVRHVAAAPAVDVWANGEVVVQSLTNPNEESLEVPAGQVQAAVSLAGETDPVLGPQDLAVMEGANTIVYAWGSAADGNLALATQTVQGMHSAPGGVPTGDTQLPADSQGVWYVLGAGVLALGAGAAFMLQRRRARTNV